LHGHGQHLVENQHHNTPTPVKLLRVQGYTATATMNRAVPGPVMCIQVLHRAHVQGPAQNVNKLQHVIVEVHSTSHRAVLASLAGKPHKVLNQFSQVVECVITPHKLLLKQQC
jgi:hypothetical protein